MDIFKFITDHYVLVTLAVVSGGMLLWPMLRGPGGSALSTLQATQLINHEDALMLDVRDSDAYAQAHIINARNIPMAQLEERAAELARQKGKTRPVIVHCDTGNRSGAGAALLTKQGFEKVFTLSGGIAAWKQAGLPVEGRSG
jgi:rhodanese-related sulfurtransferase